MNKYIYLLLGVVCIAFGLKLVPKTFAITSNYIKESIHRESLNDYGIVDKRESHTSTKGSTSIEYLLTVNYADSLYLVEVPVSVYDQVQPNINFKLKEDKFYYIPELKTIKWATENVTLRIVLTYCGMFALLIFLVAYFFYKAKKAAKKE